MSHRNLLTTTIASALSIAAIFSAQAADNSATKKKDNHMEIERSGSQPSSKGSAEWFTGTVRVDPLFDAHEPARTSGGSVTFEPGARSAWHTHPLGQTLIVTVGVGRVQRWGGTSRGDSSWRCHLDSARREALARCRTTGMTHIAIQEAIDGKVVDWMEKVSDEQYNMKPTSETKTSATTASAASVQITQPNVHGRRLSPEDVLQVAPALENYTQQRLYGDVWKRPGLSPRDRSIVTVTALIARGMAGALNYYIGQALDNGVKPREISEIITHLAFYSGFGNAFAAVGPAKEVFAQRGIGADQLPSVSPALLALDEAAEAKRAANVGEQFVKVSPALVQYTTNVLFRDLWLRPDLAPRDRSLVTVSALITSGQVAQVPYHLNKAMDNGLTQTEAGEVIAQLAFYAGWPNAFSAMPVAKEVFEKRTKANSD
jgi:4-carboxymuconolactone decarboxylase